MAKALDYPVVFKTLMDCGYICAKIHPLRKTVYEVFCDQGHQSPAKKVGHITEHQFDELTSHSILYERHLCAEDKYGNIYRYYILEGRQFDDE